VSSASLDARLSLRKVACGAGHRTLFEGLSLDLQPGQWAALRGHNGSGKSTLLRCVAGLSNALSGHIETQGQILYQSHFSGWKDTFSPRENLSWASKLEGADLNEGVDQAIHRVGLSEQAHLSFARLSAGQKRRVSLARLLISSSPVWLLDEPSTALDRQGQDLFAEILKEHLERGGLGLIATHLDIPGLSAQFNVDLGEGS
jgi:heme exporter protein A